MNDYPSHVHVHVHVHSINSCEIKPEKINFTAA